MSQSESRCSAVGGSPRVCDVKLDMSYERSRMGRVTTEIVVSVVEREHSGSKKPALNSSPE